MINYDLSYSKEQNMTKLSESITIGKLCVSNRLVMPPMATLKAAEGDSISDEALEYYRERAKYSKIGLIIAEHMYVNIQGKAHPRQVSIASDECIPGLSKLTGIVHGEGVKIIAQINHAGSAASSETTGQTPAAPSAVYHPRHNKELPAEMTEEQVHKVAEWFADAALRAKKSGFDGVEIHSAHGYLLNQFYSPLTNHRTDAYGAQSIENRTRLHCEIIRTVRKATGDDFVIIVRLGGCDYEEGGSTVDDCVKACTLFEKSGADLIHISGGINGYIRPGHSEPGYFRDMSIPVKKAVKIPVILTGGVTEPGQAEAIINEGCADLVGVGRAIFKNAHWAD